MAYQPIQSIAATMTKQIRCIWSPLQLVHSVCHASQVQACPVQVVDGALLGFVLSMFKRVPVA
jgi:hypothetical protein